jgi:hypothetical protein
MLLLQPASGGDAAVAAKRKRDDDAEAAARAEYEARLRATLREATNMVRMARQAAEEERLRREQGTS